MMLKVMVVEDDTLFALELEADLSSFGYAVFVNKDPFLGKLLQEVNDEKIDLVLIDIFFNGSPKGLELAQVLRNNNTPYIIYTAHHQPAIFEEVKQLMPKAYLLRPFDLQALKHAIELAVTDVKESSSFDEKSIFFFAKNRYGENRKVLVSDIIYVQAQGNYCVFITHLGRFTLRISFKQLYAKLSKEKFIRIHRGYLIAYQAIDGVNKRRDEIQVSDGSQLPLGETYKKEVLNWISDRTLK